MARMLHQQLGERTPGACWDGASSWGELQHQIPRICRENLQRQTSHQRIDFQGLCQGRGDQLDWQKDEVCVGNKYKKKLAAHNGLMLLG